MSTTTDQTYEAAVIKAACEMAETHVLDVLCALEASLKQLRFNIRPWHDGKVGDAVAIEHAKILRAKLINLLPYLPGIDYYKLVAQCDESGLLPGCPHDAARSVRISVVNLHTKLKEAAK